ncbi:MAG: 16S rRNA (guanine(527)-N(7))-methyltransferase RsmG [Flavobacteriales bacterium]|nr:16S rRNA (guanine(527)-N(7))-methyltransferase RsmG [Flavobacteriales bacterium]|tara:strand:+ start:6288 stop:6908 length:621 start_codon:yes stop_codon:yes gene_type:complete
MKNIVFKYFDLSTTKKDQFIMMIDIYRNWNEQINLISRKDFDFFYERHVLHSLAICKVFSFQKNTNIMDVGTGGGFPGVPLAIMFPDVNFYLVDSISKKTDALQSIVNELQLHNVVVVNKRMEDVNKKFDFIVSRAVAKLDKLVSWTKGKISSKQINSFKNGLIFLKGGDVDHEIKNVEKYIQTYLISDFFEEDFFQEKKILYLEK